LSAAPPPPVSPGGWDGEPVYVVFNPQAGRGRGAGLVQPFLEALQRAGVSQVAHALTTRAGDEQTLTAAALAQGYRRIVAVGGDGTWSNVANAIVRAGGHAALGLVPAGTGCDLAKSLDVPARDLDACARIVAAGRTRRIDVGRIEDRYFLNVAGFGFDIAVIEHTWRVRGLGGPLLYLYCAVSQLFAFPGFPLRLQAGGESARRLELLMLVIANARVFGGGFQIAPHADLADGALDAVWFGNMGSAGRLRALVRLLRGTHRELPDVATARAASFRLSFDAPPAYETDGEWNRARSAELEVATVPSALCVVTP
jgi:diacylglycerol kinase (ATP)